MTSSLCLFALSANICASLRLFWAELIVLFNSVNTSFIFWALSICGSPALAVLSVESVFVALVLFPSSALAVLSTLITSCTWSSLILSGFICFSTPEGSLSPAPMSDSNVGTLFLLPDFCTAYGEVAGSFFLHAIAIMLSTVVASTAAPTIKAVFFFIFLPPITKTSPSLVSLLSMRLLFTYACGGGFGTGSCRTIIYCLII